MQQREKMMKTAQKRKLARNINGEIKGRTVRSMDWFDDHVIVMGPNADFEDKMREALNSQNHRRRITEARKRPGRKGAKK